LASHLLAHLYVEYAALVGALPYTPGAHHRRRLWYNLHPVGMQRHAELF